MAPSPNASNSSSGSPWGRSAARRRGHLALAKIPYRLFKALDGRQLTSSRRTWRMEVYSIVDVGETRWIQLALQGLERHELTLSAPSSSEPKQILGALRSCLGHVLAPPSTLNIA